MSITDPTPHCSMGAARALHIGQADLPGSPSARVFVGADHGEVPISMFLVDDLPGSGPLLHRHPYPELFVVHAGRADFQIDDVRLVAGAGDLLIAPTGSAHRFTSTGDERLHLTAIHPRSRMSTEWLDPSN
jgi:mannose-6-phosphate isomerase-like protein (cupin superfamily)